MTMAMTMEALPFEILSIIVEYSEHGCYTSQLPLVSQHFRQQWLQYAERQARFLNQEFALGISFPTVVTRRNSWSRRYQNVVRAADYYLLDCAIRETLWQIRQEVEANPNNVPKELELMRAVERISYLKSLVDLNDPQLVDSLVDSCHAALRYCTYGSGGTPDPRVAQMAVTALESRGEESRNHM